MEFCADLASILLQMAHAPSLKLLFFWHFDPVALAAIYCWKLALRQQLAVLKQKHPHPRFAAPNKLFWVILRRLWPGWNKR